MLNEGRGTVLVVSMACVAMKPAFGDQSAWRFFHAWVCQQRQA